MLPLFGAGGRLARRLRRTYQGPAAIDYIRPLLLLLTMLGTVSQAATPQPARLADFAERPFLNNPVLSPDGRRVAVLVQNGREQLIGVIDVDAAAGNDIEYFSFGSRHIYGADWAGSQRLLVSTTRPLTSEEFVFAVTMMLGGVTDTDQILRNALMVLDVARGRAMDINDSSYFDSDRLVHVDPRGAYVLAYQYRLPKRDPFVVRIDLSSGEEEIIQKPRRGIDQWLADSDGTLVGGISYAKRRWRLHLADPKSGKLKLIQSKRYAAIDGEVVRSIKIVPGTREGIIHTNSLTGRFAAYHYDVAEDVILEPIFEHSVADVTSLVTDPSNRVVGVQYEVDKLEQHWIDQSIEAVQSRIDKALPGRINLITSFSDDRNRTLFYSQASSDPGSYYLFDRARNRVEQLLKPYERIDPSQLSPVEPIQYTARDGTLIRGYLTLPRYAPKDVPLPSIVLPHGGPFARDSWSYNPWVQFLADRGYAVLQPNFRGSTGFGHDFVEAGYGEWGRKMIDDIDDGAAWLVETGVAAPERICIAGASYGGYAALWASIRQPDRYRCAVSLNGVTDLDTMLRYDRKLFIASRYAQRWEERVAGVDLDNLDRVSPTHQAERIKVPTLLVQGEADRNVPKQQADMYLAAVRKTGTPCVESLYLPGADHNLSSSEDFAKFLARMEVFLARQLPTPRNPRPSLHRAEGCTS
ncbi:MAG: alpha/beta fold hydrolase [Pseudomonadota bacterium]